MNITDYFFTKEHEWVKIEGATGIVGISDYAQHALGDVTFVELPKPAQAVQQFQIMATVESVKAASDIYAPVSGSVAQINHQLNNEPGLINKDCYGAGWIAKITLSDPKETKNLMNKADYDKYVEGLG